MVRKDRPALAAASDIRKIIDGLVEERQMLRRAALDSNESALEANRRALAYWQLALARAMPDEALDVFPNGEPAVVGAA